MTVAELKEELDNYDEETEVYIEVGLSIVMEVEEVSRLDRDSVVIR